MFLPNCLIEAQCLNVNYSTEIKTSVIIMIIIIKITFVLECFRKLQIYESKAQN